MYLRILITRDNTFKMALADGIYLIAWKNLSQNAVCASQILTPHAKVQVEQKFEVEMCAKFLNYCNVQPLLFPITKWGVAIIFKHFYQKYFF